MKLNASAQHAFSFSTAFPDINDWRQATARGTRRPVRPFSFEGTTYDLGQRDELARKQEIICAVILSLCLLFTVVVCFAQLAGF